MKRAGLIVLAALISACFAAFYVSVEKTASHSPIVYLPTNENHPFRRAETELHKGKQVDPDEYTINWTLRSELNGKATFRQDFSLLYEDGKLIDRLAEQRENAGELYAQKSVRCEDSGHFRAISVHYANFGTDEQHETSLLAMSYDQIYVMDSPLSETDSFKVPISEEEKEWKSILDHATEEQVQYAWHALIESFAINRNAYYSFSLPYLHVFSRNRLPGLTKQQTERALAQLWQTLYSDYVSGVTRKDGEKTSPIGSTVPLVLFSKNRTGFVVLFKTADGGNVKLEVKLDLGESE
ncbi:MAG TPA: hypothetical protein VFK44_08745 [Bacillales bacterium]|nr:hypothetical protein [Bacillales bacterium]